MQKKIFIAVVLAALGVGGWIGWTYLRFYSMFKMEADKVMREKVGRFPSAEKCAAIPDLMKEAARTAKVPAENLHTRCVLKGRSAPPIILWYVIAHVDDGQGREIAAETDIGNAPAFLDDPENLAKAGLTIEK